MAAKPVTSVEERKFTSHWPQLFGPNNDSISTEDATQLNLNWPAEGPPVKWRQPIGEGYSTPIVFENNLILFYRVGDEEILECRDAETGVSRWKVRGPTAFKNRFAYSSGPYSTPVTDGELVYAVGAEGRFYCVELKTGNKVWSRFLVNEFNVPLGMYAVAASPLLVDDLLIFNLGAREANAGVIALNKKKGATIWQATDHGAAMATPRIAEIHGERYLFVFTLDGLVSLVPDTGKVRWSEKFHANNPEKINATSPLVMDDLVLISAESKGSIALQILPDGERKTLWKQRRNLQSQYCSLIGVDGHAYAFHSGNKTFRCLNLQTGKVQWEWPPKGEEGIGRGSAIVIGRQFLLLGEYGYLGLLEINPEKPVVNWLSAEPLLAKPCYSSPALANGLLYLRNEREVVCYDLR